MSNAAAVEAWQHGRTLTLDEAVEAALQLLHSLGEMDANGPPGNRGRTATTGQVARPSGLSRRELEVLRLLAGGKTSKQIAAELVTSVHTVNNQIASIYAKIGATGKTDAVAFAIRTGLA